MALITSFVQSIRKAIYGRDVRDSICNALEAMNRESENAYQAAVSAKSSATNSASAAAESEANARASATEASNYVTAAAASEAKAKTSQTAAAASEANAKASETAAKNIETELAQAVENANAAATTATEKAQEAAASEAKAKTSQTAAAASEANAKASETAAKNVATELTQVVENANTAADNANTQAQAAQSAAIAASKWTDMKTNAVILAANMQPTVNIRSSEDGSQVIEFGIPKGDTGADGKDYVLTEADKQEIAGMVDVSVDGGANIDDTQASSTTTYSSQKIESELNALNGAKVFVGDTEPEDETVTVWIDTDGEADELPIASATQLGGVMPVAKTDDMTQVVGVDEAGGLFTVPGSGGGGDETLTVFDITLEADASTIRQNIPADIAAKIAASNIKSWSVVYKLAATTDESVTGAGSLGISIGQDGLSDTYCFQRVSAGSDAVPAYGGKSVFGYLNYEFYQPQKVFASTINGNRGRHKYYFTKTSNEYQGNTGSNDNTSCGTLNAKQFFYITTGTVFGAGSRFVASVVIGGE